MSLGERISSLRKEQNLSQGDLADAMDVSRQAVSKWENDLSAPEPVKLIQLAQILDTDIEYLTTGRKNYAIRPPVVIKTVETVEKVVEKPVVEVVEKVVERVIREPVVEYVEKPVYKKVFRTKYVRNPIEFLIVAVVSFFIGLVIGFLL